MVGLFPTPYPDECLYSILCRYYIRSGSAGYESVSEVLFGGKQTLSLSIYLPIRTECYEYWLPQSSGITMRDIVVNHTLYPYCAVSLPSSHVKMEELINSRRTVIDIQHLGPYRIRRSMVKYLKYCPLCVAEDVGEYGETYWHRQHQLAEMLYCLKHQVRLVDSPVLAKNTSTGFYPAINELNVSCEINAFDNLAPYKDKLLKIGIECEWLIAHGLNVDWSVNGFEKYLRLLRDKELVSFKGKCSNPVALDTSFYEYWGKDFIDILFETINFPRFDGWYHKFGKSFIEQFKPLYHILVMCWLTGSVENFIKSNPAETPFGHPPFICENRICPHYHKDGAKIVDMVDYGQGFTAYFECSHCGMRYKQKKATNSREQRFIVDYGHLWLGELRRCCQDPMITNDQIMEILKCGSQTLANQKKKHGLMKPIPNYMGMEPEVYYKAKVLEIYKEYDEVTIALLNEKAPRAYVYLKDHDYEWIRSRVVFDNERKSRLEREKSLLDRLHEIIAAFETDGYPDEQLSYGYIANLMGSTRDELRLYRNRPKSELRVLLDNLIENRITWRQDRIAKNVKQKENAIKNTGHREHSSQNAEPCSKREKLLLNRLCEIITKFDIEGYPDKQLSYDLIGKLIGSSRSELKYKLSHAVELQAFLNEIVEHRHVWREERAAKNVKFRSRREMLIKSAIKQVLDDPPLCQISRNYIAKVAGLSRDILKEDAYLSDITEDVVENRTDWHKRRLRMAYHSKPIEGRPYSTFEICRAASIDMATYKKHRKLFKEIVNKFNCENE